MKKQNAALKASEAKPRNYVAEMEILTQQIHQENKHLSMNSSYACNPHKVTINPGKPLVDKVPIKGDESNQRADDEATKFQGTLKTTFHNFYGVPNQKYSYPQTASQEIGWYQNYVA